MLSILNSRSNSQDSSIAAKIRAKSASSNTFQVRKFAKSLVEPQKLELDLEKKNLKIFARSILSLNAPPPVNKGDTSVVNPATPDETETKIDRLQTTKSKSFILSQVARESTGPGALIANSNSKQVEIHSQSVIEQIVKPTISPI